MKSNASILIFISIIFICNYTFASPTLSINSKGKDVLTLQKKLYVIGYEITELDGEFGEETKRAVSAFQEDQNISVTGVVTNATWRALKKAKPVKGRNISDLKIVDISKISTVKPVKPAEIETEPEPEIDSEFVPYGETFISADEGEAIVKSARQYIGVPYVFGGTTPDGFDCSGFLQYVFKENGYDIPRLADEQYMLGKAAKTSQLGVGDLVFFSTYMEGASHCGFYVGDGNFLHTSSSKGVRVDSLDNVYWKPRFIGGRKITY